VSDPWLNCNNILQEVAGTGADNGVYAAICRRCRVWIFFDESKAVGCPPEATREFAIGRWQVDQKVGDMEGGSYVDYNEDGSFSGKLQQFYQGQGQRVPVHGQWNLTKLGKDEFRVTWKFDDGRQSQAVFKILDRNRVQNLDENYVSVRIPR
jgi:hypothetical protein